MSELKPCPFCGGCAEVIQRGNSIRHFVVMCLACRAEMKGKIAEIAIRTWNRRADGWIKTSDRLPNHNDKVLVAFGFRTRIAWCNRTLGVWHGDGFSKKFEDTHWQPLPEPPKGESE